MTAPASAPRVGGEMHLYYNSGSYGTPTWVLLDDVGDVEPSDDDTEIEVNLRGNYPFKTWMRGMTDVSATFQLLYKTGVSDTKFKAIEDAKKNRTTLEFAFSDALIASEGAKYLRAICEVTKFHRPEPIDGAVIVEVAIKPSVNNGGHKPSYETTPAP